MGTALDVCWPLAAVDLFQSRFHHGRICGSVNVRGIDTDMAQEVFDIGKRDACLVEMHGPRMPEQMGIIRNGTSEHCS